MTNERNNQNRPRNKSQQQQRLTSGTAAPVPRHSLHNPAMAEGLQALMRQSFAETPPENRAPHAHTRLGPIPSADKDGITYVNFSRTARTELGHVLSFDNMLGFDHPALGVKVPTIQHYWAFVQSGATNARVFSYTTDRLRSFIRQLGKPVYVPNQYALLAQAYWIKFKAYETLGDIFKDCQADLDYVIDTDNGRRRPMSAAFLVDILKQIRSALRSGRDLDLSRYMDLDVQLELKNLSAKDRAERVQEILDAVHHTARTRDEQLKAEKEERTGKRPQNGKNKQRPPKAADKAVPTSLVNVAEAPFAARINEQEPVDVLDNTDASLDKPADDTAFALEGGITAAAAPAAPAAPSAPAAPAAPADPASAASPAAPAAPSASAQESGETAAADEDGQALVLNGFVVPASVAIAA